jgi:hypothetical protein
MLHRRFCEEFMNVVFFIYLYFIYIDYQRLLSNNYSIISTDKLVLTAKYFSDIISRYLTFAIFLTLTHNPLFI